MSKADVQVDCYGWHQKHGGSFKRRFTAAPPSIYMVRLGGLLESSHRRFFLQGNGVDLEAESMPDDNSVRFMRRNILTEIEKVKELPSLPKIVHKLSTLLRDSNTSAQDIAEVASLDPALVARLLTLVNSSSFGLRRTVGQIEHVVALIGMKQIESLIVSVSVFEVFSKEKQQLFDPFEFWEHSLTVAIASRLIAKTIKEKGGTVDAEDAFLAGLLHDVGKILLAQLFANEYAQMRRMSEEENIPLYDAELAVLGMRHTELGHHLLKKWGIKDEITSAVRFHHQPASGETFVQIVHLADLISHGLGFFADVDEMPRLDPLLWEELDLSDEVIATIGYTVLDQLRDVAKMFDI